jgi:hypothetical protein
MHRGNNSKQGFVVEKKKESEEEGVWRITSEA